MLRIQPLRPASKQSHYTNFTKRRGGMVCFGIWLVAEFLTYAEYAADSAPSASFKTITLYEFY